MRYVLIFLLSLFFTSCATIEPAYYGVDDEIQIVNIQKRPNGYDVSFVVQIGKDADYYIVTYFLDGEDLYSEKIYLTDVEAKYSHGYLNGFFISEPARVKIEVRSYMGEKHGITDTEIFYINVPADKPAKRN